jgi:hypothetical protein
MSAPSPRKPRTKDGDCVRSHIFIQEAVPYYLMRKAWEVPYKFLIDWEWELALRIIIQRNTVVLCLHSYQKCATSSWDLPRYLIARTRRDISTIEIKCYLLFIGEELNSKVRYLLTKIALIALDNFDKKRAIRLTKGSFPRNKPKLNACAA